MTTATIPVGSACYFCLEEEADDAGNLPVRDCSCRGDSAGFAHLSCLTKYAEQKSKQAPDWNIKAFANPWSVCNNCKQPFQNQLAIDLAYAYVSFTEATYSHERNSKWDKMKVMDSLRLKIVLCTDNCNDYNHLLSMVDQTKKDLQMSGWIHMPKGSEEYEYYKLLCGEYEAFAHMNLGRLATSLEDHRIAIGHIKKTRAIYNLLGMKDSAQEMDTIISSVDDGDTSSSTVTKSPLEVMKTAYDTSLTNHGMNSEVTIQTGLHYAKHLWDANHFIDAERLFTKVAITSRQVHGPHHKRTIEAEELLKKYKDRYVYVLPDNKPFQALHYENDGEICVVQGPITIPRKLEDERMYHFANNLVIPNIGCTVICHGLVSASHLNGELGEVRSAKLNANAMGIRLAVYFEKKGVKSALVKPENLRIAFELPISSKE
jgi:hypothetical protein